VPGLRKERSGFGETRISMRGTLEDRCTPAVYVDGHYMSQLSAEDIDSWVNPDEIAGIEIYVGSTVPAQFSSGVWGVGRPNAPVELCGSIVIWTKLPPAPAHPASWKKRVMAAAGLAAVAVAAGALFR